MGEKPDPFAEEPDVVEQSGDDNLKTSLILFGVGGGIGIATLAGPRSWRGQFAARWAVLVLATLGFVASLQLAAPGAPATIDAPALISAQEAWRQQLFARLAPSVVFLSAGDRFGSGFFVTDDGLVLTNAHVVGIPLNPGSSGGPIFDRRGQVIGIATAGMTQANSINFGIKLNVALRELPSLKKRCQCLRIQAPARAAVYLDGVLIGVGPAIVLPFDGASHEVSAVVNGKLIQRRVTPQSSRQVNLGK